MKYVVIIPAYNEAPRIGEALKALALAAERARPNQLLEIVIAFNGCNDGTQDVVTSFGRRLNLPIHSLHCKKGYVNAINSLVKYCNNYYKNIPIIKTDADSMLDENAISIVLNELYEHNSLLIVGGHPVPIIQSPYSMSAIKARILSVRARYPLSQVSCFDVRKYHEICKNSPQPNIGDHELTLKIFFHGRFWCVRAISYLVDLPSGVLGDDVFFTAWIYKSYGPGVIRVRYDAKVIYRPYSSLRRHWMVYRRIYEDKRLVSSIPGYKDIQNLQRVKLNWRYIIKNTTSTDKVLFVVYAMIDTLERFSFRFIKYKDSFWSYQDKE